MSRNPKSPPTRPDSSGRWGLRDAKARLGELLRRVHDEGPQHLTVRGHEDVVVISADEFRRLNENRTGEALIAAMRASPHPEIEIEPPRMVLPVRDVNP